MKGLDIKNFITGNVNYVLNQYNQLSEEFKEKVDSRIEICDECPELVKNDTRPHCGQCLCTFPQLAFAKDKKCPLGKW
jgi:uncharacterized paraquat-inducible protein A